VIVIDMPSLPNLQQGWLGRSPRWLRLSLTFSLCIPGAAFLLATEWAGDKEVTLSCLQQLLVRIVVVHPFFDYWGHRLLHKLGNEQHHAHHVEITGNRGGADEFEWWCYAAALIAYPSHLTRWICLGLLQYAWFHQLSHDLPWLVPSIAHHHGIHHMAPGRNHGVSASWPDRLFGTHLARVPKTAVPVRVDPMLDGRAPPCFHTQRRSERQGSDARADAYPVGEKG